MSDNMLKDFNELIDSIEMCTGQSQLYYFTCGCGFPDQKVIDYFKNEHSVIVVDRKGKKWCAGKRVCDDGSNNNTQVC